jgi:hypothetical protein
VTVFSIPAKVDKPDECLRILWIEDILGMFPETLGEAAEKTIQIIAADSAVEVWKILNDPAQSEFLREGFDVYITDFHLTSQLPSSSGSAVPTFEPRFKEGTIPTNRDLGATAHSAGFLIGVMFASHFPNRPAIVLPYSRFDEQFGEVWRLVSGFSSENIKILDQNLYNKKETSRAGLYSIASKNFREILSSWVADGQISLRSDELNRLQEYKGEIVSDEETITLIGRDRARRLKIVALFLDHEEITDDGIPAQVVREFIDGLPSMDQEQRDACHLAELFIKDAESEGSVQLYEKVYAQRDAGKNAVYDKMPPTKPYLGIKEAGPTIDRRNAFLILCVYIHAKHVLPYQLLSSFEDNEESMEDGWTIATVTKMMCKKYRLDLFPLIREGVEDLLQTTGLGDEGPFVLAMDILSGRPKGQWQRLIRRYVDPFPQHAGDIQGSIPQDSKIGVGLRRLLDSTDDAAPEVPLTRRTSNRLQGIFEGRQCLDRARLRVARAYAREKLPSTSWPDWLSPI